MNQLSSQRIKTFLSGLLILTVIPSVGSLFWWSYPLELFSHFRVYYLFSACAITIACLICQLKGLRIRLLLSLALGLIAFNSVWVIPWYLPQPQQTAAENAVRVLTFNINAKNDQWNAIATAIRKVKPDIATIQESSLESKEELSQLLTDVLPFVYRSSEGNLTILSRLPLVTPQSKTFDNGTALVTSLQINGSVIGLIAVHATVPSRSNWFKRRNAFLLELTTYLQQQKQQSLILLGDLNLTPWSPYYSQLILKTGFHNTRIGFGIEPSWVEATTYARYPSWITYLIKIPIDHILVSPNLKVLNCQTLKAANADHRMLWSDLALRSVDARRIL